MSDIRKGKPSGSALKQYSLCPGSWQMQQGLPDQESAVAKLGTDVHWVLAGGKGDLTDEGVELVRLCSLAYEELAISIIGTLPVTTKMEERIWVDGEWSGSIDRIDLIGESDALVVDYKTGRGAVDPAESNLQMRAYAVLAKHRFPHLENVIVAVIAPRAGGTTIAKYDIQSLALARREIKGIIRAVYAKDAPRVPSNEACKWCRAKAICPEVKATSMEMATKTPLEVPALSEDQILEVLNNRAAVKGFIEAVEMEAERRLKNGTPLHGYTLKDGRTTRKIENAEAAFAACDIDSNLFLSAVSVSVPKLEKAFAEAKGLKGKEAKAAFETALTGLVSFTQGEPVLSKEAA
jgi:CRISPR/Cas system-associated exonuclease Cas4 (RecB family)